MSCKWAPMIPERDPLNATVPGYPLTVHLKNPCDLSACDFIRSKLRQFSSTSAHVDTNETRGRPSEWDCTITVPGYPLTVHLKNPSDFIRSKLRQFSSTSAHVGVPTSTHLCFSGGHLVRLLLVISLQVEAALSATWLLRGSQQAS